MRRPFLGPDILQDKVEQSGSGQEGPAMCLSLTCDMSRDTGWTSDLSPWQEPEHTGSNAKRGPEEREQESQSLWLPGGDGISLLYTTHPLLLCAGKHWPDVLGFQKKLEISPWVK